MLPRTDGIKKNDLDVAKVARPAFWPQSRPSTGLSDADRAIPGPPNRDESSANAAKRRSFASHKAPVHAPLDSDRSD